MYCLVAYWRTCPYIAASRLSLSVPTHLKPVSITLTLTSSSSLATSLTHSTLYYLTTMSKRQRSSRSKKPKLPQHVRKRQKLEREAAAAAAAGHLPDDSGVRENDEKDEQNTTTDRSREVIVKVKMVTKEGETAATADAGEEGPGYEEYGHWTGLYISASEGDEYEDEEEDEDEDEDEDERQPSKKRRKVE
jgi:hypothetical protein